LTQLVKNSFKINKIAYLTRVDEGMEVKIANGKPKPKKYGQWFSM
jgi:hypothetical protein